MSADPTTPPQRSSRRLVFKLICVVCALLVGFVVLEGGARMLGLGDPVLYYTAAWGGMRPLPNQKLKRLQGATVTIDANGFRSAKLAEPGARRILYLGDSVTWGGTSIDDTAIFTEVAADVLRRSGRPVYAMNAAVNATSLINHAEVFQGYKGELDAVVWIFPWGDVQRTYATGGQLWPARFKPKLALVEVIDHAITKYWSRMLRDIPPHNDNFLVIDQPAGHNELFKQVIEERKERNLAAVRTVLADAKRRGVPVVVGVHTSRTGDKLDPIPEETAAFVKELAGDGVTIFDPPAVLRKAPNGVASCFIDNVHLSVEGHRLIGEALGEQLAALAPAE